MIKRITLQWLTVVWRECVVSSSTMLKVITGATILGNLSVAYFSYQLFIADNAGDNVAAVEFPAEVEQEKTPAKPKKDVDPNEKAVDSWSDANILSVDGGYAPAHLGPSY